MVVLLWIIMYFPLCETKGSWNLEVAPTTENGENNITLRCYYRYRSYNRTKRDFSIFVEIQKNESSDWKDIATVDDTGVRLLNSTFNSEKYSELTGWCFNRHFYIIYCSISIRMTFTLQQCYIDPAFDPNFRCQFFIADEIFKSQTIGILSIKGHSPKNIKTLTTLPPTPLDEKPFRLGDVVQLQCVGEVENTNGIASQNIRWCKKVSGTFIEMPLQGPPRTTIVSSSGDGCTQVQESKIFYHIMQDDEDLHVMCESGYKTGNTECGKGSVNSSLFLNTLIPQEGLWRISPIIIYDKNSIINSQNINISGSGKTVDVLCTGSAFGARKAGVINWCVKSNEVSNWTKIVTQEKVIKITVNNSDETITFSRMTYHITEYNTVVHFLCEISTSSSSSCGSGSSSSNTSIQINAAMPKDETSKQTQLPETPQNIYLAPILSVLLCAMLFLDIVFVVTMCRRKKLTFMGFVFTVERKKYLQKQTEDKRKNAEQGKRHTDLTNGKSEAKITKKGYEKSKCNSALETHDFYENEDLKREISNKRGIPKLKTAPEMCEYDELQIENEQQKYEDLILRR